MRIRTALCSAVVVAVLVPLMTSTASAGTALASGGSSVTHTYDAAAQSAAASYWTSSHLKDATTVGSSATALDTTTPPPNIPNPVHFDGIKTVGALFFVTSAGTTTAGDHFCTASVINSGTQNIVLTAAHCVAYGDGVYAQDVVYVPEWHDGISPYGAWPVENITVTSSWNSSQNVDDDFAFLEVAPPSGTQEPIQQVTGGLTLGSYLGYNHPDIDVIGYNNTDNGPIICATSSFYGDITDQEEFYCNDYNDGTSGGPWIIGLNPVTGTGTVFGDIGGYDQGGDYPWYSYSSYYDATIDELYLQAQASQL
jgi:V8-like Glu-specific endopeptidase